MTTYDKRTAGVLELVVGGERLETIGDWSYSLGGEEREAITGDTGVVGKTSKTRVPFIEGNVFVKGDTDVAAMVQLDDSTVMLVQKNGKAVVLREAWYAGDGTINASEGSTTVRYEGVSAEEVIL